MLEAWAGFEPATTWISTSQPGCQPGHLDHLVTTPLATLTTHRPLAGGSWCFWICVITYHRHLVERQEHFGILRIVLKLRLNSSYILLQSSRSTISRIVQTCRLIPASMAGVTRKVL